MAARSDLSRRRFLTGLGVAGTLPLSGCFDFAGDREGRVRGWLESANRLTYRAQRWLLGSDSLAREYSEADIRQDQRPNGSTDPRDADYRSLAENGFEAYRLQVGGLVDQEQALSLADLRGMESRTQITRHDCVEGWSVIAKWTGTPLAAILERAGVQPNARYVVFECFDTMASGPQGPVKYYESIDMLDARHPQTILAYALNDETLPVSNGAPLRVRVERQLGYKMAKYIRAIRITDTLADFGRGNGGFWEDRGYAWFAGI